MKFLFEKFMNIKVSMKISAKRINYIMNDIKNVFLQF